MDVFKKVIANINASLEGNKKPRVSYVIGDNGSGKSRLLRKVCDHYEERVESSVISVLCITNSLYDRFTFTDGRVRKYLGVKNSANAVFQSAVDREMAIGLLSGISLGRKEFIESLSKVVGRTFHLPFYAYKRSKVTASTLPSTIDQRKIKSKTFSSLLTQREVRRVVRLINAGVDLAQIDEDDAKALLKYFQLRPRVELYVSSDRIDEIHKIYRANEKEEEEKEEEEEEERLIKCSELSSGERNIINLSAKVIGHACDYSVILIDEPEISLHPQWQMEFHSFLMDMLKPYQHYHVLIATHSSIIVSEAAKQRDEQAVYVLSAQAKKSVDENGYEEVSTARVVHSGMIDSCEELLLDYFNIAPYKTKMVDVRIAEALLKATDPAKDGSDAINLLETLKATQGVRKDKQKVVVINDAILLVERYLSGRSI